MYGTIKNNGDSSYVTFDGSDFLTPISSAMGYEDGDRVMVLVKDHRAIVVNNMTSPGVTGKYVKENYASFENLSAVNAQVESLRANMITTDTLTAKVAELGYLKAEQADIKFATIENLNASNAEISALKTSTIKTTELSAEVAKLGYASVKELEATTAKIDDLASKTITADNLRTEIAKIGYLTADEADIRYLTVSTANATFLHADMSDMDIAKIQTLFATAGIVSDMTIKDGHITGELSGIKVSANDISAGRLDAATIEVVNLNAANITVGTINGQQIANGAIDLSKLGSDVTDKLADTEDDVAKAVADAKKAIADSLTAQNTSNSAASTANSANSLASTAKSTADSANTAALNAVNIANNISVGGRNLWVTSDTISAYESSGSPCSSTDVHRFMISYIPVNGNKNLIYQVWNPNKVSNNENTNRVALYDSNKKFIRYTTLIMLNGSDYQTQSIDVSDATYIRLAAISGASSYDKTIKIKFEFGNKPTDWTPAPEDVDSSIDTASIKNWCYDGNLAWMNGAKIYASTIVSDAIAAGAITAVKIKAGAITADKIAANAVTAGKIAANAVTAGTIAAGAITTDKLSAKAITSEKIATDAVTADKILAKSITAAKIAAGTITSDEIASGTIKAANINVTDLVGNSAFINSLKSNTVIVGLQNDINGISVGGRNLIRGSGAITDDYCDGTGWITVNGWNGCSAVVTTGSWSGYYIRLKSIVERNNIQPGDTVTLSIWVSVDSTDEVTTPDISLFRAKDGGYTQGYGSIKLKSGKWVRLTSTFVLSSDLYNTARFEAHADTSYGILWSAPKLEKGNRATDWTPAPEDVDSLISAAQSTANSANTLAGTANSAAVAAQTTANTAIDMQKVHDTRRNNQQPSWYINNYKMPAVLEFKVLDVMGVADHGPYGLLETKVPWHDSSGGYPKQKLTCTDGTIYTRYGVSDTAWSSWKSSELIADSAVSTIGKWCYNNDITYINGGKIYTGTVTADQLAANSVTAGKILAGAITADKIASKTITADNIKSYTITADQIAANTITAAEIKSGSITASKLNVSLLSAISANLGTVTAGTIKSTNYVAGTSGMMLSLSDGRWDSKYTKINSNGSITCGYLDLTGHNESSFTVHFTANASGYGEIARLVSNSGGGTLSIRKSSNYADLSYDRLTIRNVDDNKESCITTSSMTIDTPKAYSSFSDSSISFYQKSNKKSWNFMMESTYGNEFHIAPPSNNKIIINDNASLSATQMALEIYGDIYLPKSAVYTPDGPRGPFEMNGTVLYPCVYGNKVYRLTYGGSYMEVATTAGLYGVTWWESDARLKENFTPVNFDVLDCIRNLRFKAFDWKDKSKENIHQRLGLVADEVQCIIPEAVFEVGENKIKNINTGIMSTYALKGVQDLYARIRLLEQEVINLQNQLSQKGNQNG